MTRCLSGDVGDTHTSDMKKHITVYLLNITQTQTVEVTETVSVCGRRRGKFQIWKLVLICSIRPVNKSLKSYCFMKNLPKNLARCAWCVLINPLWKNSQNNSKWSLQAERMILVLSLLKKRKRKRKYWVHLMLRLRREEGEFHLKELRDYPEWFKAYYRILMLW